MDRKEKLNDIIRGSLYTEVRELSDGRSMPKSLTRNK